MDYQHLITISPELFITPASAPYRIITDPEIIAAWQKNCRAKLASMGQPQDLADLGVLMSDLYITLVRDLVEFPDGDVHGYNRFINTANLKGGQGVVVMPFYEGKILLIYLFRHPTRKWHYEVPRGFGEPNIPAADNARKEVLEEVEGKMDEPVDLGDMYDNTGLGAHATRLFFAHLTEVGKPNKVEGIKSIKWVTVPELEDMIRNEEITDGFTIAVYARAKLKGLV
jgi:ADP-ribose pyrophosphatase